MSLFFFQAKQRASIKWLLSKAYDHRTPEELKEPFYKNHDVSHLQQSPTDFDLKLFIKVGGSIFKKLSNCSIFWILKKKKKNWEIFYWNQFHYKISFYIQSSLVYKIFSYLEHRGTQRVLNVSYYYSKERPLICFQLFTILVRIVVISKSKRNIWQFYQTSQSRHLLMQS